MSRILCICLFASLGQYLFSQSPYQLNFNGESQLFGIGLTSLGASALLSQQITPINFEEITQFSTRQVLFIDRLAVNAYSLKARKSSDLCKTLAFAFPLLLMTNQRMREDKGKLLVMASEVYLITQGLTSLSKRAFLRPRPFVFNPEIPYEAKQSKHARYSFFSGHTAVTTALCTFTAKVFSDYYPDSPLRPFVWGISLSLPALTGYLRVKGGKHFPTDVMTGYLVGGLIGFVIPHLHKTQSLTPSRLQVMPDATGIALVYHLN